MKSKANINGHPIHPFLVPFPIAFLLGAFCFDLGGLLFMKQAWTHTAGYLNIAGICAGFIAAIPGAIDYFKTIPPKSSAKKRGTKHALINSTALIMFMIAFIIRRGATFPEYNILIPEIIGAGLLVIGGWMGGTLVYKNQIGIDIRYANSGKWNEAYIESNGASEIEVAKEDELKLNQMKLLHIDGTRIVLGKTETGFVAFEDRCTHKGGSLAGGAMICETVQCPWHGAQFNLKSGEVVAGPAEKKIKIYKAYVKKSKVWIVLN